MRWPRTRCTWMSVGDLHLLLRASPLRWSTGLTSRRHCTASYGTPRSEHVVVEAVLAEQQLVDPLEEHARLGALDDAVVVGAR